MRLRAAMLMTVSAVLLSDCGWTRDVGGKINPESLSLADRCADIMKRAMPFADIDVSRRASEGKGIRTIVAQVEGTRGDLPDAAPDRDLAAECQFDNSTLIGFRWTKGGPTPEK